MADPLDTVEAILDNHPANRAEWTNDDMTANVHALRMLVAEMESGNHHDEARWQRMEELKGRFDRQVHPAPRD